MSLFALDEIPFETVYLHGMILDKSGKKMSKSKGNGVDPLDMVKKFGADASRLSSLMGYTPGNDARFSEEKVEAKRNFINKLWNISRFILGVAGDKSGFDRPPGATAADKWILSSLDELIKKVTKNLDEFDFSLAADNLADFSWNKLADWYLEMAKFEGEKGEILIYILRNLLKLWHPFIPFVTENIWQSFNDDLLMVAKWPEAAAKPAQGAEAANQTIAQVITIVQKIREARATNKIEPKQKIRALIYSPRGHEDLAEQAVLIKNLRTGIAELEIKAKGEKPTGAIALSDGETDIYLFVAVDTAKEKGRLIKEQANLEKLIVGQEQKLANAEFTARAPKNIVAAEKDKLADYQKELEKIINLISAL
jgi:valyl-tRNA synthetase